MLKSISIGIVLLIIVIAGIILLLKSFSFPKNKYANQGIVPTSTSAPTPTSIYGNNSKQLTKPIPADTVSLTANGFVPNVLTIKRGTTVTWMNNSGSEATINSDPHPIHTAYPPLNLGQFNDGDTLQLTFNKPGKYGYHNHFDATQTGTIMVQ